MVKISSIRPYCPNNASEFTTNPYDVIGKEEEEELTSKVKTDKSKEEYEDMPEEEMKKDFKKKGIIITLV